MIRDGPVGHPIEILLIEDNLGDIRLTLEALKDSKVHNTVHVATDGLAGMAFLRRQDGYAAAPRPDLILLDLNLPGKDGRAVLAEIKTSDALHDIPVLVLTASRADRDLLQSYELQADGYLIKPIDFGQLVEMVHAFADFWLCVVQVPAAVGVGRS
jgi:CheY-like chemotaxis protein